MLPMLFNIFPEACSPPTREEKRITGTKFVEAS
jgi:hypothetical protein